MDSDPTPGDPEEVRSLAEELQTFADDVGEALGRIRGMAEDRAVMDWAGLSAEAFRSEFDGVPSNLQKLQTSYDMAAQALQTYWPTLETAQGMADRALDRAIAAQADLSSAQAALSDAQDWVSRAGDEADRLEREGERENVEPPSEAEVRAATRDANAANEAASSAQGRVDSAEEALSAARELAEQAREMREEAARVCAQGIDEASDAGIQNRSWWEDAVHWVTENWDTIVEVCKVIVAVLGVVVMIIGGPLAWVVVAAALVVLADTLYRYANGEATLLDVAFAALDCIPGLKGLTTAAGLAAGLRNVGRNLRDLGRGGLRGADDIPVPHDVPPMNRCVNGHPVDMVSGEMVTFETDLVLPGVLPVVLRRSYLSTYQWGRFFGASWASTLDERLEIDDDGVRFATEDGMILSYPVPQPGRPTYPTSGPRRPLTWAGGPDDAMLVTDPVRGWTRHFLPLRGAPAGTPAFTLYLVEVTDRHGNSIRIDRDASGVPQAVRHSGGYHVDIDVQADRVTRLRLRDASGEHDGTELRRYGYTVEGFLSEVYNGSGKAALFAYDERARITRHTDRNGHWYRFVYDDQSRCVVGEGEEGVLSCAVAYDSTQRTTRYTDARGHSRVYRHDDRFRLVEITDPLGYSLRNEWDDYGRLDAPAPRRRHHHTLPRRPAHLHRGAAAAMNRPIRTRGWLA